MSFRPAVIMIATMTAGTIPVMAATTAVMTEATATIATSSLSAGYGLSSEALSFKD